MLSDIVIALGNTGFSNIPHEYAMKAITSEPT